MRALAAAAAVAAGLASAGGAARAQELQRFEYRQVVMAIEARIVLYAQDEATAKKAAGAAFAELERLDAVFSDYREDSAILRLCAKASDQDFSGGGFVGGESGDWSLANVLSIGQRFRFLTQGAFDISVGPLTRLWRAARAAHRLPEPTEIDAARSLVGRWRYATHAGPRDGPILSMSRGTQFDVGGIAKGYSLGSAVDACEAAGAPCAMIEMGGDLVAGQAPPGLDGWSIDVGSGSMRTVTVAQGAVSTSGDENQHIDIDGVRYSHVIDPRSGWALAAGRRCVAIILESEERRDTHTPSLAAESDALATAACLVGAPMAQLLAMQFGASIELTDPAFTSLFDGTSLTGWTPRGGRYDGDAVWTVEDGCIVGATGPNDAGGLLYTATPHTSFEFQCEVKLDHPFDSGIFVRMSPEARGMQLTLDDRPDGEVGGLYSDGWIEHARPEAAKAWKRGEWNHVFLRCTGFDMRVEAWINGVAVMDRVIPQEFGADGKPAFAPSGLIGLQVHGGGSEGTGNKVRFRDLQVRDLPVFGEPWATDRTLSPPETKARDEARDKDGWRDLLAKDSVDQWEAIDGESDPRAPSDYAVNDGVLAIPASLPAGYLRTKADFGDFDLRLDVRQARMSNSGLFLRSRRESVGADGARVPAGNPAYSGCEIQLLDDWNWETVTQSKLEPWQFTGSLYGAAAPARRVLRPIGEWNTLEVLARGPRLACALNGQTLWDLDTSKLAVDPPFAQRARAGFLGLQRYAAPDVKGEAAVWLRDLFVRER